MTSGLQMIPACNKESSAYMELIKVKNASYGRYEELLLKRDQLYREAESILISYTKEFGELTAEVFSEKIECIRLKKAIAYCQAAINRGNAISIDDMHAYLDKSMAMYKAELKSMLTENENARNSKTSSIVDVQRAKKLYRKLAKLIHPDINPRTRELPELSDLWNRIVAAYHMNDPIELSELEVLTNKIIADLGLGAAEIDIPDIDDKIQRLEDEINEIITAEPYTYCELLNDAEAVKEKKDTFNKELEEYKAYHAELDGILEKLVGEKGARLTWIMN